MPKNNKKNAKKVSKAPAAKKASKPKAASAKKTASAKTPAKKAPAKKAAAAKKPVAPKKVAASKKKPAVKAAPAKTGKKATKAGAAPKVAAAKASATKPKAPQPEVKAKASKAPAKEKAPKKVKEVAPEEFDEELEAGSSLESEMVEEVILTDAEGRRYCRVRDCDQLSSVDGYCRYHYLLFWKRIQVRKKILTEGKLERYVEDLTGRYPDKFLDMLRKDLRSEKEFVAAIQELEIDEGNEDGDFEDEDQNFIDEVRGMSEGASDRGDEDY